MLRDPGCPTMADAGDLANVAISEGGHARGTLGQAGQARPCSCTKQFHAGKTVPCGHKGRCQVRCAQPASKVQCTVPAMHVSLLACVTFCDVARHVSGVECHCDRTFDVPDTCLQIVIDAGAGADAAADAEEGAGRGRGRRRLWRRPPLPRRRAPPGEHEGTHAHSCAFVVSSHRCEVTLCIEWWVRLDCAVRVFSPS
jgi:hypothetical protein